MDQQIITPIENFIFNGITNKLHQIFDCYVQFSNSENRMQEMLKIRKEKGIKFPYLFVSLSDTSFSQNYYNSNYLSRHGMVVKVAESGNALAKVKLLPCTFTFKVEYFTDKNDAGVGSALWFTKRWMFARRLGYLKFNIKYGQTYTCPVILDESLTQPMKPQESDALACYQIEGNFTVHGFVSESQLLTDGVLTQVDTTFKVGENSRKSEKKNFSIWRRDDC